MPLDRLARRFCWIVARIVVYDLDDFDEAEGGPQPAEGRELVIVDLRHKPIMPPSSPEHRAGCRGRPEPDVYS